MLQVQVRDVMLQLNQEELNSNLQHKDKEMEALVQAQNKLTFDTALLTGTFVITAAGLALRWLSFRSSSPSWRK